VNESKLNLTIPGIVSSGMNEKATGFKEWLVFGLAPSMELAGSSSAAPRRL